MNKKSNDPVIHKVSSLNKASRKSLKNYNPIGIKRLSTTQMLNPMINRSISPGQKKIGNTIVNKFPFANHFKCSAFSNKTYYKSKGSNTNSTGNLLSKINPNSFNNTNNFIINTLNVSTKNMINSTLDYSEQHDNDIKGQKVYRENEELRTKTRDQEKKIEHLEKKNGDYEKRITELIETNKRMQEKYNSIKESENQLLAMLYVVDQSGINVDQIIDNYNKQNQSHYETTESIDSSRFTPITLEQSIQPKPMNNIPKLNFSNLQPDTQLNTSLENEINNNNNHHQINGKELMLKQMKNDDKEKTIIDCNLNELHFRKKISLKKNVNE